MSDKKQLATMSDPAIPRNSSESVMGKMNKIFNTLKAHYPQYHSTIKNDAQESEMLKVWAKALISGNVTEGMLRIGMSRAKAHAIEDKFCKWPSIGEFISWCHGIPSPDSAYFETKRNCHDLTEWEPSHAIVALAGKHVGFHQILNSDNEKHFKTEYIRFFCELISRVLNSEEFTYTKIEKPIAIEEKKMTPEEVENSKIQLGRLMAQVAEEAKVKTTEAPVMTKEQIDERKEKIRSDAQAWLASRGDK